MRAIAVSAQKDTELLVIRAVWGEPEQTAAIANGIVAIFIEANRAVNKENLIDTQVRLASRFKDVSEKWRAAETALKEFSERYNIVDVKKESEQLVAELVRIENLRIENRTRRATLVLQMQSLDGAIAQTKSKIDARRRTEEERPTEAGIQAQIDALVRQLEDARLRRLAASEIVALREDLNRARALFEEGLATKAEVDKARSEYERARLAVETDPESAQIYARIDSLRASIVTPSLARHPDDELLNNLVMKRYDAGLELVAVDRSLAGLEATAERINRTVDSLPEVSKEYARLSTETAGLTAEVKGLERMLAQAETALAKGAGDFTVISPAPIPVFPTSSNRKIIAITVSFLILLAGWGSFALYELVDRRIRSPAEARIALGARVLATLPRVDPAGLFPAEGGDPLLIEHFRLLALRLRHEVPGDGARIMIASPAAGGGRSMLAANLGLVWGRSDERVLVMETETRQSAPAWPLQSYAVRDPGAGPEQGLGDYMLYRAERFGEIVVPSLFPGMDLVPGGIEEAVPDLLGTTRFANLLDEASETYSIVLLETPPVLACADASIVAPRCDAAVLVFRARTVTPRQVRRTIEGLGATRVLGIVMTDVIPAFNRE